MSGVPKECVLKQVRLLNHSFPPRSERGPSQLLELDSALVPRSWRGLKALDCSIVGFQCEMVDYLGLDCGSVFPYELRVVP